MKDANADFKKLDRALKRLCALYRASKAEHGAPDAVHFKRFGKTKNECGVCLALARIKPSDY